VLGSAFTTILGFYFGSAVKQPKNSD
jgi:hypothetical protein